MANVLINGQEHDLESLSDNARGQLSSLRVADQEIAQLQAKTALTQTARMAYGKGLAAALPTEYTGSDEDAKTITVNDKKYLTDDLSDDAKQQIRMLRLTDQKLKALEAELAMAQTARNAYGVALKGAVEK